jgi:hypothetical protein
MNETYYVYFGEFYWLNVFVLNYLDNYLLKNKDTVVNIITLPDYAIVMKAFFKGYDNINIYGEGSKLYVAYRRGHSGQPLTGYENNFSIINEYGYCDIDSQLLFTNSWLENSLFFNKWKNENNLNNYGDPVDNKYDKEPLPDKSLKSPYSNYEYLLKQFPSKPWNKYIDNEKNTIKDLVQDLFKKKTLSVEHSQINRRIFINPNKNEYIHIFPRNRSNHWNKGHMSHICIDNWIKICKLLKEKYPNKQICCHGHMESFQDELMDLVDITTNNITDSINLFYNTQLVISPPSGLIELAVNCGLKNIIYIYENGMHNWTNNPFNVRRYNIHIKNGLESFEKTLEQVLN